MNKLDLVKSAVGFVSSIGVSQIVAGIAKNNTVQERTWQKGTVYAGRFAISMVINDYIRMVTDKKIDVIAERYAAAVNASLANK